MFFIGECIEDLKSSKEEFQNYCTSYNKSSKLNIIKDNTLSMDSELFNIINNILEISRTMQYLAQRNINVTKYELSKIFSNFFDSFGINELKNDETPTEFTNLKKLIKKNKR